MFAVSVYNRCRKSTLSGWLLVTVIPYPTLLVHE